MIVSHWMAHPGGDESRMFRLVGVPLWEPTRVRALRRGVGWWLRGVSHRVEGAACSCGDGR